MFKECQKRRRIEQLENIQRLVREIEAEENNRDNEGRLKRLLWLFPGITQLTLESGGLQRTRIEIKIESGHTFTGYSFDFWKCSTEVAWKIYDHFSANIRQRDRSACR